ncbi:BRCT domain-containing protein [Neocallimastix sp. 'constans']
MNLYKDIVICCSSQNKNEKEEIYESIIKLGGSYSRDLKKSVTHLIASSSESEKYKVAIEKEIPILTSDWMKECIKNKENINPYDEMKKHLFPPFKNFYFYINNSLKEKEDYDFIIQSINFLGGKYTDKPCSDLAFVESENYKDKLKIPKNNFDFFKTKTFFLSESFNDSYKLALLKIIGKGNGKCAKEFSNNITTFIIKDKELNKDEKKLLLQSACGTCSIINFNWLIRCYLDKCYIPESPYEITNTFQTFQSSSSIRVSLFKGLTFFIHFNDEYKKNKLKEEILLYQGEIYDNDSLYNNESELLIVTPFSKTFNLRKSDFDDIPMKKRFITAYWIDKCIRKKKLYNFDKYPMFTPCKLKYPINGFEHLVISTTGFSKLDRLYVSRLITAIGSKYSSSLTKSTSILIFHDERSFSEKISKAYEYNKSIVPVKWLYDCYNQQTFICFDTYRINAKM